ncbi:MAG: TIGR03960 family B12-binding radical SAM protein [Tissierellia bacterium]|nr:TIGR03960 family B12-binding radical SAM protein [Tissierellia bacterium]
MARLEACLKKVSKPARYIGGELGSVEKDFKSQDVTFALCFPDVYEVGMSHLGLQILYFLTNQVEGYLCERAFAPWPDMEKEMRKAGLPLFSLESKEDLRSFDIVGFTLQYELSYTNILNMLDLANIPVFSRDRGEEDPLIIAGGPCAVNPEPLADFIDLFILGEGEEVNLELFKVYRDMKASPDFSKEKFLRRAAEIEGIYVPSFYEVTYDERGRVASRKSLVPEAKETIKRRRVHDVNQMFYNDRQILPFIETVHDRAVLEMFRGCTQGCRFCQAGMIYRPIREKSPEKLMEIADQLLKNTGYNEISLMSLSSCDYSGLVGLVQALMAKYEKQKTGVSLPSLRLDSFMVDVLKEIEKVRKSGLTFAPEAGSQRLRDVINKGVTEEDLYQVSRAVFDEGWSRIKLYYMIGLPTETLEDVMGISHMAHKVKDIFFNRPKEDIVGNFKVTASASCFVPKPFTPFQWVAQDSIDNFFEKIYQVKGSITDPKIKFQYHDPYVSRIEGILARGDRKLSALLYRAWEKGQVFDGWTEFFSYDTWVEALEETGLDGDFYARRVRNKEEVLPWDFIDIGVKKDYLWKEYERALQGTLTSDCRKGCNRCGIENCEMWGVDFEAKTRI